MQVVENTVRGAEVGRDLFRVRECCRAAAEAWTMGSGARRIAGGECGQIRS